VSTRWAGVHEATAASSVMMGPWKEEVERDLDLDLDLDLEIKIGTRIHVTPDMTEGLKMPKATLKKMEMMTLFVATKICV